MAFLVLAPQNVFLIMIVLGEVNNFDE